jgi:hypothetical protein
MTLSSRLLSLLAALGAVTPLQALANDAAPTPPSAAPAAAAEAWQFGAVIDVAATSRELALGGRGQGLQLGHSDLSAAGPLGRHLHARLGAAVATHDGTVEKAIEEAWLETRSLPAGLTLRAGRFAPQIGRLNEQHPHADDFVERPLLYRAFLGGHWNDDGLRLNLTLPTETFWMLGAEVFRGKRLVAETASPVSGAGAFTLVSKWGGDLNREHSWQAGLSYLHSRRIAAPEAHEEGAAEEAHEHDHGHGALFGGKRTWLIDATWKWAPEGNNRAEQVRVSVEAARTTGINEFATGQRHQALGLQAVWRFDPAWEVGARVDRLRVAVPHEDHVDAGRLSERALMLAWKPSHFQSLRLQLTRQGGLEGLEGPAARAVSLQYVLAFGAHGAHAY